MPAPEATRARPVRLRVLEGGRATPAARATEESPQAAIEAGRRDARRLGVLAVALTVFGLVMVDAASPQEALGSGRSVFSVVERQVLWAALGAVAYLVCARWSLTALRRRARVGLVVVGALLLAVLVPHLGKGSGGSSRWLGAGPLTLQPSELAKLAFALFAADFVARRRRRHDQRREIVTPLAVVVGVLGVLILKQPDLGTAMVVVAIAAAAWYAGGVEGRLLAGALALIAAVGGVAALSASYRRERLLAFLNPFGHASGVGYQLVQSLSALGSGHLTGSAIASSSAAWFLPNASSDFIFAAIGNDFGLIGCVGVLAAFAGFAWLGIRISARARDPFAAVLAACLTCWVIFQAIVNVGGVIGVLPDTGIPLPFLSAGGSALIVVLAATGLLANVARAPHASTEPVRRSRRPSRPATAHPSARPTARVVGAQGRPARPTTPRAGAARPASARRVAPNPAAARTATARSVTGRARQEHPVAARPAAARPVAARPVAARPVVARPVVARPGASRLSGTPGVRRRPVAR